MQREHRHVNGFGQKMRLMGRKPRLLSWALLCLLGLTSALRAQSLEEDVGAWLVVAGQGHLQPKQEDSRLRWWFDGQLRFADNSNGFNQSIVRPGVGYDLSKTTTLWLGYGWFHTDPSSKPAFEEHRIWQQFTWNLKLGSSRLQSRTRLEQRFLETGDDVGWRFREFVRFTPPPSSKTGFGLRFWDEVFVNLNDTDWGTKAGFDQNRFFAGVGWILNEDKDLILEVGYLNQYIRRPSAADSMNHLLFVQLLFTL